MASRSNGDRASKSATKAKAAPAETTAEATPARAKRVPARVLSNVAALSDPRRFGILTYVAGSTGAVTLVEIAERAGISVEDATLHVNYLKQRKWLESERIPKGSGGPGWRYRLSDTGRDRMITIGA